jgi:hypothetical protein
MDRSSKLAGWLLILGGIPLALWLGEVATLRTAQEAVKTYREEQVLKVIQP